MLSQVSLTCVYSLPTDLPARVVTGGSKSATGSLRVASANDSLYFGSMLTTDFSGVVATGVGVFGLSASATLTRAGRDRPQPARAPASNRTVTTSSVDRLQRTPPTPIASSFPRRPGPPSASEEGAVVI